MILRKKCLAMFFILSLFPLISLLSVTAEGGVVAQLQVAEGRVAAILPDHALKIENGDIFYPAPALRQTQQTFQVGDWVSLRYFLRDGKKIYLEVAVGANRFVQQQEQRRIPKPVH